MPIFNKDLHRNLCLWLTEHTNSKPSEWPEWKDNGGDIEPVFNRSFACAYAEDFRFRYDKNNVFHCDHCPLEYDQHQDCPFKFAAKESQSPGGYKKLAACATKSYSDKLYYPAPTMDVEFDAPDAFRKLADLLPMYVPTTHMHYRDHVHDLLRYMYPGLDHGVTLRWYPSPNNRVAVKLVYFRQSMLFGIRQTLELEYGVPLIPYVPHLDVATLKTDILNTDPLTPARRLTSKVMGHPDSDVGMVVTRMFKTLHDELLSKHSQFIGMYLEDTRKLKK